MKQQMKLSKYAKLKGLSYRIVWQRYKDGLIPNAFADEKGSIFVVDDDDANKSHNVVCYARVSTYEQKKDLDAQIERLNNFCINNGYVVSKNYKEIASGLNDDRPILNNILKDKTVTHIIVEHKDRLTRFGFAYLQTLLERIGVKIIVANLTEQKEENIIEDFVSTITSYCARIYGKRHSVRKTQQIISCIKEP